MGAWRPGWVRRFDDLASFERAPARTRATRWGALTARQRAWAASMSLNAMAKPVALESGPRQDAVRGDLVTDRYPGRGEPAYHEVRSGTVWLR